MMRDPVDFLVFVYGMLLSANYTQCDPSCSNIIFPNTNNQTLVVPEHSEVNISFRIRNKCLDNGISQSTVEVKHAKTGKLFCQLNISKLGCERTDPPACECLDEDSEVYGLVTEIHREDNGTWTWHVQTSVVHEHESIDVTVTYPPEISDFSLKVDNKKTVSIAPDSSVAVVCSTQKGYPGTQPTVRLLWENGTEMKPVYRTDNMQIVHFISNVQCDDMGYVVCDMEEPGVNRSIIPLLIECPPKFTGIPRVEKDGQSTFFSIPFRSHTATITAIKLTALSSRNVKPGFPSHTFLPHNAWNVFGSPPDLKLKIKVTDKKVEIGGQWQMQLSNGDGSDVVVFNIGEETTTGIPNATYIIHPPLGALGISTISVICGLLLVVTISCIIIRTVRKPQSRIYENNPAQGPPRGLPHRPQGLQHAAIAMHDLQERQSRQSDESHSNHTYEEVDDTSSGSETGAQGDVSDQRMDSSADDYYLHPVSSTADLRATQASSTPSQPDDSQKDERARSCASFRKDMKPASTVNPKSFAMSCKNDESASLDAASFLKCEGKIDDPCYVNTHL